MVSPNRSSGNSVSVSVLLTKNMCYLIFSRSTCVLSFLFLLLIFFPRYQFVEFANCAICVFFNQQNYRLHIQINIYIHIYIIYIYIHLVESCHYIYMCVCVRVCVYHHHHVALVARISLTLSRHSSLSFIALGRSSGQHPVSSHSC